MELQQEENLLGEETDLEVFLLLRKQVQNKRTKAMEIVKKYEQLGIVMQQTTELEELQMLIDRVSPKLSRYLPKHYNVHQDTRQKPQAPPEAQAYAEQNLIDDRQPQKDLATVGEQDSPKTNKEVEEPIQIEEKEHEPEEEEPEPVKLTFSTEQAERYRNYMTEVSATYW